jgi:sugar lactone lactonase YvrE
MMGWAQWGVAITEIGVLALGGVASSGCADRSSVPVLGLLAGGLGGPGSADGRGSASRFRGAKGAAFDGSGNLFIADAGNQTIRKVVIATGEVTTLAGSPGLAGSSDGIGAAARFNLRSSLVGAGGITTDGKGSVFVMDWFNSTIRKVVVATGEVTTLAGAPGLTGITDGIGSDARFGFGGGLGGGITSDNAGNLFVADAESGQIRRIVADTGEVTTLAGPDATGASGPFAFPEGIAWDGDGNLFVTGGGTLQELVIATGEVTTTTMQGFGGNDFVWLASDSMGSLFVANGSRVFKVAPSTGEVTFLALSTGLGLAADGHGTLFVANSGTIDAIEIATATVTTIAGTSSQSGSADGDGATARFAVPVGIVADGPDTLYVADGDNAAIRRIDMSTGGVTTIASDPTQLMNMHGVTADGVGDLFVASSFNMILKIAVDTGNIAPFADGAGTTVMFDDLSAIASDRTGNLFVADYQTIRKVTMATGAITTIAGSPGQVGARDGTGDGARFNFAGNPGFYQGMGMATDDEGNLFVADTGNDTIRKVVVSTGAVTTVAGAPGMAGSTDGLGANARFDLPVALALDGKGDLLVADANNGAIRRVTIATGAVRTWVGSHHNRVDLGRLPAGLNFPVGVVVQPTGDIAIVDQRENAVLVVK